MSKGQVQFAPLCALTVMNNTTRVPLGRNREQQRSPVTPWVSLVLASASLACGSEASLPVENLGNTPGLLAGAAPPATQATGKERLNGHWTGLTKQPYIEVEGEPSNYTFPSGSRSIGLDLSFDENSFISGSIVFGAGSPPPLPQAGVAYPPGFDYGIGLHQEFPPIEGFSYALSAPALQMDKGTDESEMLTYQEFAAFAGWCPLQPSLPTGDGSFSCVGGTGFGGTLTGEGYLCQRFLEDDTQEAVDCNMVALCLPGACACDEQGCAQRASENHVQVELDGDELTLTFGDTMVPMGGLLGPVRMSRAASP